MTSGEHNLKYYNLFQVYLKLYEVRKSICFLTNTTIL